MAQSIVKFLHSRRCKCIFLLSIVTIYLLDLLQVVHVFSIVELAPQLQFNTDIKKLQSQINTGKRFIHTASRTLCRDETYMSDIQNLSKSTFITLLSDSWNLNYLRGALVWTYEITRLHSNPCIDTTIAIENVTLSHFGAQATISWFKFLGKLHDCRVNVIIIDLLHNANAKHKRWQNIYTKLMLFNPNLTNYKQYIYFDADNYPLQPMYELFTIPCGYLLGATKNSGNDLHKINAGLLIIRPHQIIYDSLIAMYELEVNVYKRSTTEQQMIIDLWNGYNEVYNMYWYQFPYQYNSPWWNKFEKSMGGWQSMKNIHNRFWRRGPGPKERADKYKWDKTWNKIWKSLNTNALISNTTLNLNKCSHKDLWNKDGVCTVDMLA